MMYFIACQSVRSADDRFVPLTSVDEPCNAVSLLQIFCNLTPDLFDCSYHITTNLATSSAAE